MWIFRVFGRYFFGTIGNKAKANTLWVKIKHPRSLFVITLANMERYFNNPFTLAFCNELRKKFLYNPPPNLKSVWQIWNCEIWIFNCTSIENIHSIQKCAKSFIFSKYLPGCDDLDNMSTSIHSQYYSMCSKYPSSARTHALNPAHQLSMDASMTHRSVLNQAFNRRCRNFPSHWKCITGVKNWGKIWGGLSDFAMTATKAFLLFRPQLLCKWFYNLSRAML